MTDPVSADPQVPESAPSRFIEKVSLATGEVLEAEIAPKQLLVHHHRDYHLVDIQARRFMSRAVASGSDADKVRRRMKEVRRMGHRASEFVGKAIGQDPVKVSKALFGLKDKEYFFRYKKPPLPAEEIDARLAKLRRQAEEQMEKATVDGQRRLRVLLTGGTGFVGKEILWQAAHDDAIAEMVVLIRPKEIRDRKTKELIQTLSPAERGETLLDQLWLVSPEQRAKFRFVGGDVEESNLGLSDQDVEGLRGYLTHVIHCAASVSFDDPYEESFRANVVGSLNALRFSHALQEAPESPFVAHLSIETSYIHGRQAQDTAREDEVVFPRNFYNNYYELTKAMASLETERFMLSKGLRVVQLCPAIVIGEYKTGNNRGDTKVVNAPVNVFGRAHEAITETGGRWRDRSSAAVLAKMACIFPGDPSAELNLIPVDWVVAGILGAVRRPRSVGERIHLATDNRITSEDIRDTVEAEIGVDVKLAEPTLHRNVTLPVLTKVLSTLKQERLAYALDKLGTIFGGYSEWGQPVHQVGRDVEILGLPEARPNTLYAFRMLCRHNRWVQKFGRVWDLEEISRREKVWDRLVRDLEAETGKAAAAVSAQEFQSYLEERLDPEGFEFRESKLPTTPVVD